MKPNNYIKLLIGILAILLNVSCEKTKKGLSLPEGGDGTIELVATEPIPILGWNGIPGGETTKVRFEEMKNAGFNLNLTFYMNETEVLKALDVAAAAGMKIIASCPQLLTAPEATVNKFKDHPGLAAYYLRDEPGLSAFPELAAVVKRIRAVDDKHFCYINLLPSHAEWWWTGTATYPEYVDAFVKQVPVQVLTFDNYPITKTGIRPGWYSNLELIANTAKTKNMPFWAFALATAHDPYPKTSIPQLRLQVYSNLAYGAQGIQYFTYWTPSDPSHNWTDAPISKTGTRNDVYDIVKEMNAEIITLSPVFKDAKVEWVKHTGDAIPEGTQRLGLLPNVVKKLKTTGVGAVVSLLKKKDTYFLMVVNRDLKQNMSLDIQVENRVKRILKNGSVQEVKNGALDVEPGDAVIYAWID